MREKIKRK